MTDSWTFAGIGAQAWLGAALVAVGVGAAVWVALAADDGAIARLRNRYFDLLRDDLDFLMVRVRPERFALIHAAGVVALAMAAAARGSFALAALVPVAVAAPLFVLARQCEQRRRAIEQQLPGWLLVVANALRSTPSIGEALATSTRLVGAPLGAEVDLALKSVALGAPLDEALLAMGDRIGSSVVSSALATLLIARQTGGDLSATLEQTAATLREMERLEGVVRTKTAEGKSQAWVLAMMPFGLAAALHAMDDQWLPTLTGHPIGWGILAASAFLWLGSIAAARKILAVDI
ncbi:MAG: hypothetical protein D6689_22050 [Deltaproteobacteria bacterium]|nr:MAG: hypothetical protein D6689_22050 [Deltaproteobacteria bacterium]